MSDAIREFLIDSLSNWTALLLAGIFLIVAVGITVALAAYFFRRMAARHNINVTFEWHGSEAPPSPSTVRPRPTEPKPAVSFDPRRAFVTVHKVLTLMLALGLLAGAMAAYWTATPGNGLLLVAIILSGLALIAFLSIGKYDHEQRQAEEWRSVWQEFSSKVHIVTAHADPDVHVMDKKAVATAKRMAADGASLDDICRATERDFSRWDAARQEAFRRVIRAMLDAG